MLARDSRTSGLPKSFASKAQAAPAGRFSDAQSLGFAGRGSGVSQDRPGYGSGGGGGCVCICVSFRGDGVVVWI